MKRNGEEWKVQNDTGDGIMVSGTETEGSFGLWEETAHLGQD